jgi:hypothetical protein
VFDVCRDVGGTATLKSKRPTAGNQDYNGRDLKFERCLSFVVPLQEPQLEKQATDRRQSRLHGARFEIRPVFDVCCDVARTATSKSRRPTADNQDYKGRDSKFERRSTFVVALLEPQLCSSEFHCGNATRYRNNTVDCRVSATPVNYV